MADRESRSVVIPIVALLLVAVVAGDLARRALVRPAAPHAAAAPARTVRTLPDSGPAGRGAPGGGGRTLAAVVAATAPLDVATRAVALRRIERDGADTYLPAMLAAGDSALHRWGDDRAARPVRIAVLGELVPGFREMFVANVGWAITRWNAVGLPIYLEQVGADTAGADIVLTWADRLDSNRAGRADVSWEHSGRLAHVHVTLATHTPGGRQVLPSEMVALALHELGHALGLGHSPVAADALHPETSALDLTARDRRTALLLYALPPGSLK
ncbi:MAG TPA: matrixin family metalloprotease [Gemmatimonadales bacterium]|nr:matrixin family metalloprotease [Gemmatimonadales bacterium]